MSMPAVSMSRTAVCTASSSISSRSPGPSSPCSQALTAANHQPGLPWEPTTAVGISGSVIGAGPAGPVALGACPVPDAWRLRSAWRVSFHSSWRAPDYPQNGRVAPGVLAPARASDPAALDDVEAAALLPHRGDVRLGDPDRAAEALE